MDKADRQRPVLAGAPLIGEGNIVDAKAFRAVLERAGIPCRVFYPDGFFVRLARRFHMRMSMSTKNTVAYSLNSEYRRGSLSAALLKRELQRAIVREFRNSPGAACFLTSQNMTAEESVDVPGVLPTLMASSDVLCKYSPDSIVTGRQRKIIHLVWNREALHVLKDKLGLEDVHLIIPVDPLDAFERIGHDELPFPSALNDENVCYIKLSGSGGDAALVNEAVLSLWEKSHVRSIVFPGTDRTKKKIISRTGRGVTVDSCLDPAVFYNHARAMQSRGQLLLAYPSEQVKHVAILAQNNISPGIVWLPPRGHHEVINLVWAVRQGFSGTVCIPEHYHRQLRQRLQNQGLKASEFEFVTPERLCRHHFKPGPEWTCDRDAVSLTDIITEF